MVLHWGVLIGNSMELSYGEFIWYTPLGIPWNCMGASHCEFHAIGLWVIHWDLSNGHAMELLWDFSMGMPLACSMCSSKRFPNWQSMEVHWEKFIRQSIDFCYGQLIGMPQLAFHIIALGILIRNYIQLVYV